MSLQLLERRLADSAKTRGTIIQAFKTEDRYKEHRIKRTWKASEVFAMIKESQDHEKHLARRGRRHGSRKVLGTLQKQKILKVGLTCQFQFTSEKGRTNHDQIKKIRNAKGHPATTRCPRKQTWFKGSRTTHYCLNSNAQTSGG